MCFSKNVSWTWNRAIFERFRELYHIQERIGIEETTTYLESLASKTSFTEYCNMQNLCGHHLPSVCLVLSFWLAVKWKSRS